MDGINDKACQVDYAGVAVLEYLLPLPNQELCIMRNQNMHEMIAIITDTCGGKGVNRFTMIQQIFMGIHVLTTIFLPPPRQRFP